MNLLAKQMTGRDFIGLAWLGKMVGRICGMSSVKLKIFEEGNGDKVLPLRSRNGQPVLWCRLT
jgi:hypothetical protein